MRVVSALVPDVAPWSLPGLRGSGRRPDASVVPRADGVGVKVAVCLECKAVCVHHCECAGCDLWICRACRMFGNARYWVPVGPFVSFDRP